MLTFAALLYAEHGDVAMTRAFVHEAGPVTSDQEQKAELDLMVHILAGWVMVNDGDPDTGVARIREGLDGFVQQQRFALETLGLTFLARAYRLAGDDTAATATAQHALELTEHFGQLCLHSELLCLVGELLAGQDRGAAERMLRRAVTVAREQRATTLEIRAQQAIGAVQR